MKYYNYALGERPDTRVGKVIGFPTSLSGLGSTTLKALVVSC